MRLAGCGKTIQALRRFDDLHAWEMRSVPMQDAQKTVQQGRSKRATEQPNAEL